MFAMAQMQTPLVFAGLVLLVLIGVVLFGLIQWCERLAIPWHVSIRRDELRIGSA
jgi:NitT/TauT family transport system permease protein